jgi:phosphoribosylformimino-5-aminoimidazole carboxamide ribotide isomerase
VIVYPAIDLRGGRVVQWVGGRPESEQVSLPDPAAIARRFEQAGFAALHVVDLDAALGSGDNRAAIGAILEATDLPVQVGGGVRTTRDAEELLAAGAARVLVGTRAVRDRAWLTELAGVQPGRVVVAADCRDGEVLTHGWTTAAGLHVRDFVAGLDELPLAAVLVTDVGREGRLCGPDLPFLAGLASAAAHPLLAAGGIRSVEDLAALAAAGVGGAVLGMALYRGDLDAARVAAAFAPQQDVVKEASA